MLLRCRVPSFEAGCAATGDDEVWNRWVPSMWRALGAPADAHVWPDEPDPVDGDPAWWAPSVHLVLYALGWQRPDLGLRRWWAGGRPTTDPHLALLAEMLGDRAGAFVAWASESAALRSTAAEIGTALGAGLDLDAGEAPRLPPEVAALYRPDIGSDPLHLADHALVAIDAEPAHTVVASDVSTLTGVIVVDRYRGRYRALHTSAQGLPAPPVGRSWHLDVFCLPIGRLGTFRRSRGSGRWFVGAHRLHQAGSPDATSWALE